MSGEIDTVTKYDRINAKVADEIERAYREMAADLEAEAGALEWGEALIIDVADGPW